jgi:galactokinase/galacturonokinase
MQYHIFSPYRVCPLGAHVDHQHGLVTGFAINKGVDLWFDVREDSHVHLESKTFEGIVDFEINAPSQVRERHWGDYARGAKFALRKRFELKHGITGVIQGSLPVGGLSSSAAVLIAYVMAFAKANNITLRPFEVVKIASEAEREYIGLNNGLLDQACIALGKKDELLFLDCDTNEYRLIPFGGFKTNTNLTNLTNNAADKDSCNSCNSCSEKNNNSWFFVRGDIADKIRADRESHCTATLSKREGLARRPIGKVNCLPDLN